MLGVGAGTEHSAELKTGVRLTGSASSSPEPTPAWWISHGSASTSSDPAPASSDFSSCEAGARGGGCDGVRELAAAAEITSLARTSREGIGARPRKRGSGRSRRRLANADGDAATGGRGRSWRRSPTVVAADRGGSGGASCGSRGMEARPRMGVETVVRHFPALTSRLLSSVVQQPYASGYFEKFQYLGLNSQASRFRTRFVCLSKNRTKHANCFKI